MLSELLKQVIAEAETLFDHPLKQYALFEAFEDKVNTRAVEGIPERLVGNLHARAYYGVFRVVLGDAHFAALGRDEETRYIEEALAIDRIVDQSVAEHSLNPQDIEAAIRKGLLPGLFKLLGMNKAKEVIEAVIQITRIGLSRRER